MHFAFGSTLSRFDCLLCPLRSLSANALRLRLSSLAVYRVGRVQVSVKSKEKAALVDCSLLWCGLRFANGAKCACVQLHATLRVTFACYVHCARCPQMLRACVSLRLWSRKSRFPALNKKSEHRQFCAHFFDGAVWHNLYEPVLEETAVLSAASISFSVFVTCSFVSFKCSGLSVKL